MSVALRESEGVERLGPNGLSDSRSAESLRFWSKVEITDGCWLWIAGVTNAGYGAFTLTDAAAPRRQVPAHRFAYEELVGPIPAGLEIDHTCHNGTGCSGGACVHRRCVNPAHLEAVTHRENILRGNGPFADRARQTHCLHGHPFNEANTYVRQNGTRWCLECRRIRRRAARARGVRH